MNLKDIVISLFMALSKDEELLNLLEVPTSAMKDIKKQIIEERYPSDLVSNNLSRVCVYENPTTRTSNPLIERGWVGIDIYVHKDKNKIDRRILLIVERLINLLDTENRLKAGKTPILSGVNLSYYNRIPNMYVDDENYVRYGLIFCYDYFK